MASGRGLHVSDFPVVLSWMTSKDWVIGNRMSYLPPDPVGSILEELRIGGIDHQEATDRLFGLVYGELHRLASQMRRHERPDHTLQTSALVHEAYLHLVRDGVDDWENRAHFFGVAARAMRQILVDHARRRSAAKRGGGWARVTLDDDLGAPQHSDQRLLDLDSALTRLAEHAERMARVAELRIFGCLKMGEIAHVMRLSRSTVQDDWRIAKMWLARDLADG